ncbi:MAG TPA: hypothetical protein VGI88_11515, partial [Verrucomicrobiae bacterium]
NRAKSCQKKIKKITRQAPRVFKSLILLIIDNNCRKLLGEKKVFMPQSKIRPSAASKELQTRANFLHRQGSTLKRFTILRLNPTESKRFRGIGSLISQAAHGMKRQRLNI